MHRLDEEARTRRENAMRQLEEEKEAFRQQRMHQHQEEEHERARRISEEAALSQQKYHFAFISPFLYPLLFSFSFSSDSILIG